MWDSAPMNTFIIYLLYVSNPSSQCGNNFLGRHKGGDQPLPQGMADHLKVGPATH